MCLMCFNVICFWKASNFINLEALYQEWGGGGGWNPSYLMQKQLPLPPGDHLYLLPIFFIQVVALFTELPMRYFFLISDFPLQNELLLFAPTLKFIPPRGFPSQLVATPSFQLWNKNILELPLLCSFFPTSRPSPAGSALPTQGKLDRCSASSSVSSWSHQPCLCPAGTRGSLPRLWKSVVHTAVRAILL